ncbi:ADM precursor [Takifugu rubripes]|uniref:Adrenomedullin a n=1 Tax=Takifugu rubripes TaxID=31033 RepID=Q75XW8_TAKRU|nr:ADM precursor [Takifugu rubripes]BAD02341.1 adrenomedullin-1 [Takifugu rubripes]|eukprot:NP_001027753.1 ADM precursor [Takifugu rubripes]
MKLIFQSFLYCCLLATVAHCVEFDAKPQLKKRLNILLRNRLRRDLARVSVGKTEELQHFVRPEDIRDTLLPHSSTDINIRTKRSKNLVNQSRKNGCSLGTCTVHDLAFRLHQLGFQYKIDIAPVDKISPQGYGRRRRSLPEQRVTLRLEQGRLRPVWSRAASQVHKLEALLRQT